MKMNVDAEHQDPLPTVNNMKQIKWYAKSGFLQEAKTVGQFIGIVKPLLLLTCLN
jgi:hypothetical protein